jgi:hypothetical protein
MKNSSFTVLLAVLLAAGFGIDACAQGEPASEPSPAMDSSRPPLSEPLHQKYTADAWTAFENGHYAAAITNADLCVARFGEAANRSQAALDSAKVILPTGVVTEAERKCIAQYGILQDVATCLLIKGWAEEKLGHTTEARKAYTEARKLTYARSSRPKGDSFWSPSENAAGHLSGQ